MIKAKDIMTKNVIMVTEKETLKDVIALLSTHRIGGLPVVDEEGKLKGSISVTDIIKHFRKVNVAPIVNISRWVTPQEDAESLFYSSKGQEILRNTTVGEAMKEAVYTTSEEEPLNEVARLMKLRRTNRVHIVDENGKVIGIVTRSDMVQGINKI